MLVSEDRIGRDIGEMLLDFWYRPSATSVSQQRVGSSEPRYSDDDLQIIQTVFADWRTLVRAAARSRDIDLMIRDKKSWPESTSDWVSRKLCRARHLTESLLVQIQLPSREGPLAEAEKSRDVLGQSSHPSPGTGSAQSPSSSMIGPPPTYYDPDMDSQPQNQDYSHWISHYSQVFPDTLLYPQPFAADPVTERPMQPPQHMDRYQFVNTQPSSDTSFPFFTPQNWFDGRPGPSRPQHNPSLATHTHGWPQTDISQGPTSDHQYIPVAGPIVHPAFGDTLGPIPYTFSSRSESVHGSVLSPSSEATLTSAPSTGPSETLTAITLNTSSKQEKHSFNRIGNVKRQKADTDDDEDANLPRPNRR